MSMELDPRADRLRENDDRSIDAYECRDFIWPGGTRSFTEFVSQDGSRLCRGVRGRGVEFRRSIVGGFPPRHAASISVPRPRRVVRWLRFNNSSRLPAGTDSSRDSIQKRAYYDPTAESRLGFGQRRSSLAYFWNGLEPNIATWFR